VARRAREYTSTFEQLLIGKLIVVLQ